MQNESAQRSDPAVSYFQIKQALIKTSPSPVFSQIISTNSFHGNTFHPKTEIKHNLMVHFHSHNTNLMSNHNKSIPVFCPSLPVIVSVGFLAWFNGDPYSIILLSRQCTRAFGGKKQPPHTYRSAVNEAFPVKKETVCYVCVSE